MAQGVLWAGGDGEALLEVGAYKTTAGASIAPKRWRLALSEDAEGGHHFRILAKSDGL